MVLLPATAVTVGREAPPVQDEERPFGVATTSPAGRVSVKPTLPAGIVGSAAPRVKVSVVMPPTETDVAPKFLEIVAKPWADAASANDSARIRPAIAASPALRTEVKAFANKPTTLAAAWCSRARYGSI
jgi:hypothetical protein